MPPTTWAETMGRFAEILGRDADAQEWLRQALQAAWGVNDPTELPRQTRSLALQRIIHVVYAVEGCDLGPMLVFTADGGRARVRRAFASRFGGLVLAGPPWRLGPGEMDRPTYEEWSASAGFD